MADSRNEAILEATINDTEYDAEPQSRIEELLLELKAVIESGGGGGEITIDPSLSPTSPNAVRNSAIYAALEGKADTTYVDEKILEEIGDITTFEYYLCGAGEYDAQGVPTVANPDTSHIYLTPTSGTNLNMYAYVNSTFTFLGTTEVNLDGYVKTEDLADVAFTGEYADIVGKPDLSTVATTGAYSDLSGKPSLADVATSGAYADLSGKPNLATVATSGSYNDLSNKPNLATVATSGNYNDLSNKPTIPTVPGNLVTGRSSAYTIVVSSSAPASGTASNVITIVV